jgi:hypothetical protein
VSGEGPDDDTLAALWRCLAGETGVLRSFQDEDPDPAEEERALARFREACARYDADPAERARIHRIIAEAEDDADDAKDSGEGPVPPWYIAGAEHLRPDPDAVTTVAELIEAMRLYRIWAGDASFRDLAKRCGGRASAPALFAVLKQDSLPRLALVRDFVGSCGATADYRERFDAAWRRVAESVAAAEDAAMEDRFES